MHSASREDSITLIAPTGAQAVATAVIFVQVSSAPTVAVNVWAEI